MKIKPISIEVFEAFNMEKPTKLYNSAINSNNADRCVRLYSLQPNENESTVLEFFKAFKIKASDITI